VVFQTYISCAGDMFQILHKLCFIGSIKRGSLLDEFLGYVMTLDEMLRLCSID
jgi:hypothetical protein